jgi:hypothetical protein
MFGNKLMINQLAQNVKIAYYAMPNIDRTHARAGSRGGRRQLG